FVLVWEEKLSSKKHKTEKSSKRPEHRGHGGRARGKATYENHRRRFHRNLLKAGLLCEKEQTLSERRSLHYLKLSAPWDVLVYYAEELCMRAPLQAQPNPDNNTSDRFLQRLHLPNPMYQHVPNKPLDYYTCTFRKSKLQRFLAASVRPRTSLTLREVGL
ncbi:unnamed protein product, partial [Ranitomeya imitator]